MSLFDRLQIPTTASIINQHMTGRLGVALLLLEREREIYDRIMMLEALFC